MSAVYYRFGMNRKGSDTFLTFCDWNGSILWQSEQPFITNPSSRGHPIVNLPSEEIDKLADYMKSIDVQYIDQAMYLEGGSYYITEIDMLLEIVTEATIRAKHPPEERKVATRFSPPEVVELIEQRNRLKAQSQKAATSKETHTSQETQVDRLEKRSPRASEGGVGGR